MKTMKQGSAAKPVVEVRGAVVERDLSRIIDNLSWVVNSGENWVVFGPNGAGKTTLLNLLTAYIWPGQGTVRVLGKKLGEVDVRDLRREIAVVSDWVGENIHGALSGLEVLVTGMRAHLNVFEPPSKSEIRRATEAAHIVGIEPLLRKPYSVMSTGEKQRLLIGRALACSPKIMILDEPCSGLDLAGREFVLHTIERIEHVKNSPVILMTTHHVEEVTRSISHALLMKNGEAVKAGPIHEVFTSRNLGVLYGIPIRLRHDGVRWSARAEVK